MKAGILAAGEGSRFLEAGWDEPKPLIRLRGKPLIGHVLEGLFRGGAENVGVLLNARNRFDPVEDYLRAHPRSACIRVWRKTTPSSFASFRFLLRELGPPPFLISTVDAVFADEDLGQLMHPWSYPPDTRVVLAVTPFAHDEKPLWVEMDESGRVTKLGGGVSEKRLVTAGLYLVIEDLVALADSGEHGALRGFLGEALEGGGPVWGHRLRTVLDIDRPEDLRMAESVLENGTRFPNEVS